jgi:HAD superfamily hydrolase (TIGR01509 family)
MNQPIAAVIFDMDGLMFDTERLILWAWQKAMADCGFSAPEELYLKSVGLTDEATNAILVEALGPEFPLEAVRERERQYLRGYVEEHGAPIKPGLLELLDFLDELGLPKAIGSSSQRRTVERMVASAGLQGRFVALAGGDEVTYGKPAPDIYLLAARRLGVSPAGCLVLEDSEPGVQAARAAGMTPILVPDLKPPSAEGAALARWVLPSLHEVKEILQVQLVTDGGIEP